VPGKVTAESLGKDDYAPLIKPNELKPGKVLQRHADKQVSGIVQRLFGRERLWRMDWM